MYHVVITDQSGHRRVNPFAGEREAWAMYDTLCGMRDFRGLLVTITIDRDGAVLASSGAEG